jgi:hypothetical protein
MKRLTPALLALHLSAAHSRQLHLSKQLAAGGQLAVVLAA